MYHLYSVINCIEFVAQEKNLYHVGDTLVAELGKEAYKKYPLLYVFGNNPEANGDHAESRTSTISEVANSTGMDLTIFIKD